MSGQQGYGDNDPIAALATAPGLAAIAVIRTSGAGCIEQLAKLFSRPNALLDCEGQRILFGKLHDGEGGVLDEVLLSVFRAPRSFTGEDSVEISCHGGSHIARRILAVLTKAGIRQALPGEFSFRAFSNGKLDLTQAEAIMDLVASSSDTARSHALRRLDGELRRSIEELRDDLLIALAACELYLDYSEEDISLDPDDDETQGRLPRRDLVEGAIPRIAALLDSWKRERLWIDGATVALAGAPNAGKSSLFNRLLREERALISEEAGTTRDWLEARLVVDGIPLRILDTAGLRDNAGNIEKAGIERTRERLEEADLVLWLEDGSGIHADSSTRAIDNLGKAPDIRLWTKADIAPPPPAGYLAVSAKSGMGIGELLAAVRERLEGERLEGERLEGGQGAATAESRSPGVASERQKDLLAQAKAALEETLERSDKGLPLDLVAPRLREAADALGAITGEITTEDILDSLFGSFCVGK